MRARAAFQAEDVREIDDSLLSRAREVIAMEDVYDGNFDPAAIALRHDVDASSASTSHALDTAVQMAEWECERGYRSTYYVLHTAPYWNAPGFAEKLHRIAGFGHEVGIHADAIGQALRTGEDPDVILARAVQTLRGFGFPVRGVAGHGNPICNRDRNMAAGEGTCANDEQFVECARPTEGEPDRTITRGNVSLTLKPRPLADFGLEYEALNLAYYQARRPFRISDSGGRWMNPGWEETVEKWNRERVEYAALDEATKYVRQLHFLQHPDWYEGAYDRSAVAA